MKQLVKDLPAVSQGGRGEPSCIKKTKQNNQKKPHIISNAAWIWSYDYFVACIKIDLLYQKSTCNGRERERKLLNTGFVSDVHSGGGL